jgi:hypothetical protein
MSTLLDDLERQARALSPNDKATLARILIEELDPALDAEVEQFWIGLLRRSVDTRLFSGVSLKRCRAMRLWQESVVALSAKGAKCNSLGQRPRVGPVSF